MNDVKYHLDRIAQLEALLAEHKSLLDLSSSRDAACQPYEETTWSRFQSVHPCPFISFNSKEIFEDLAVWIHGVWRDQGQGFEPPAPSTLEHFQLLREYQTAHIKQIHLNIEWAEHQLVEKEMTAKYKAGSPPSVSNQAHLTTLRKTLAETQRSIASNGRPRA